jgi:hypothetical protein
MFNIRKQGNEVKTMMRYYLPPPKKIQARMWREENFYAMLARM